DSGTVTGWNDELICALCTESELRRCACKISSHIPAHDWRAEPWRAEWRLRSLAMKDVAIVSYCRTGIAKATRGALNQTHGIAMAAHVMKQAVARAKIEAGEIEDVVLGCGLPEGATGHNVARNAALYAGFG